MTDIETVRAWIAERDPAPYMDHVAFDALSRIEAELERLREENHRRAREFREAWDDVARLEEAARAYLARFDLLFKPIGMEDEDAALRAALNPNLDRNVTEARPTI